MMHVRSMYLALLYKLQLAAVLDANIIVNVETYLSFLISELFRIVIIFN